MQERAAREAERAEFASYAHYMQAEMRKRDAGQGQQIEMLKVSVLRCGLSSLRRARSSRAASDFATALPSARPRRPTRI